MKKITISEHAFTSHFLQRYVYRFQDNRLQTIFDRVERAKKPTKQQLNRIKKISGICVTKKKIWIDRDMVIVVDNKTLITCWRLI